MNPRYKTTRNSRYVWQKDYILVKGNAAFEYAETLANHEIEKERTFKSSNTCKFPSVHLKICLKLILLYFVVRANYF